LNIILNLAADIICEFMRDKLDSDFLDIKVFREILMLVLLNNVFMFNDKFYIQTKGIAMGCKCGPSVANIYVYHYEKLFLNIHRPLCYFRYIDDIFIITSIFFDINLLINSFPNLKLNVISEAITNFLDLNIYVDKITNSLIFSLYLKPTNTFSYLKVDSNHPEHIINNIPFSLFLRIKKICTFLTDYLFFSRKLLFQLMSRGYKYDELRKIKNCVNCLKRSDILQYRKRKKFYLGENIIFLMEFDLNYIDLKKSLYQIFNQLKEKFNHLRDLNLKIIFKTQTNLNSMLVHNRLASLTCNQLYKANKCKKNNCYSCFFLNEDNYIKFNNFYLPIQDNTTCDSIGVIYIIKCKQCPIFYVGESERSAENRLKEHLHDIDSFIPYIKKFTPVSYHFNLKNHNKMRDLEFFIITDNINDVNIRKYWEAQYIHLIRNLNFKVINDHRKIFNLTSFGLYM